MLLRVNKIYEMYFNHEYILPNTHTGSSLFALLRIFLLVMLFYKKVPLCGFSVRKSTTS
jgi:hypothetical protein